MSPPIIRIEDWDGPHPIVLHYMHDANEIDFGAVFLRIERLKSHPGLGHGDDQTTFEPCTIAFLDEFHACGAIIFDYFADFLSTDRAMTQSIWFQLFDAWQAIVEEMPHDDENGSPTCPHAQEFDIAFEETLELVTATIYGTGTKARAQPREHILHDPHGEGRHVTGTQPETGPWISGLKPWQQFLLRGSPGVAGSRQKQSKEGVRVRYVPMAAIAIVKKHTERARYLAAKLVAKDPDTETEFLYRFERNTLDFPAAPAKHGYLSLSNRMVTYHLVKGAPPIYRAPGYEDAVLLSKEPDFTLLDDCVGICKGDDAYEAQGGGLRDDDDEEEGQGENETEEDENEEENESVGMFDMWKVLQSAGAEEDYTGEKLFGVGHGKIFENWFDETNF